MTTDWKVLPHDPPVALAENLWRVEGALPDMALRRCMVVVRLANGELLLHNGVALDEAGMAWLEGLGRPAYLVVPSAWHRLDAARFKARHPAIRVLCPPGAAKKVASKVAVDAVYGDVSLPDPEVRLEVLDGLAGREGALIVRSADGVTVVLNDILFNLEHQPGLFWFIYGRLMGNAGRPKITPVAKMFLVKDKRALRAHLERLAETPGLRRVVVAHGAPIEASPGTVLRAVAAAL